jgi:hypothetical protein
MTISSNLESFAGRRVVDFAPDDAAAVGDPAAVAWRLRLESYGDDHRSFDELFDQFLAAVALDRVEALVVGTWAAEMYDVSAEMVVRRLGADVARLPRLRSLFLGDITFEEFEISWIRQTDVTPLLLAFPGWSGCGSAAPTAWRCARSAMTSWSSWHWRRAGCPPRWREPSAAATCRGWSTWSCGWAPRTTAAMWGLAT